MFWNVLRIKNLEIELEAAKLENIRLEEFYGETKEKEIIRLTKLVDTLTVSNTRLSDAKEAARKELEWEFHDRFKRLQEDFNSKMKNLDESYTNKLQLETETNATKIEFIEANITNEVTNRVTEANATAHAEYKEWKLELKHYKELMDIYKKKFEWGKIELWADEIKWMLLSANPNGDRILSKLWDS